MANQSVCEHLVQQAAQEHCDMILFPEMTLTGFTMQPERFAPNHDVSFFQALAMRYSIGIVFGYIEEMDGQYQNMLAVLSSHGEVLMNYAKIHPFSYGEESKHYIGGDKICTCPLHPSASNITTASSASNSMETYRMSGFICYDLRFPEIFQKASADAVLLCVIANWPESRISHWHALLQARAIENQCFLLGVNRTGTGGGLNYIPSSAAYDPYGNLLTPADCTDELIFVDLQPEEALHYRQTFPVRADRREWLY
jgi:predicted amidohydrolase